MNTAYSLAPLFRHTVGFDRFNDLFEAALRGEDRTGGWPPYDIEKIGEDQYRIVMAVAGFRPEDIEVTVQQNRLQVAGKVQEQAEETGRTWLYKGIARRAFERRFNLADHIEVRGAALKDGLLVVDLARVVPESARVRTVPVQGG